MTRQDAIHAATQQFDSGRFRTELSRLVACRTESQDPTKAAELRRYLTELIEPRLRGLGFETTIVENEASPAHPVMVARRTEAPGLPTLLLYGHADVQLAHAAQWRDGLDPWRLTELDGRWYGRGVADNKGQHLINLVALEQVLQAREHRLGYNVTVLLESGEETGSPGLADLPRIMREELAADLFIGSDGPRLAEDRPTIFLGSRGAVNFTLDLRLHDGGRHSGNWGGVLRNPATTLANAIASMVGTDGRLAVDELRPRTIPPAVRDALTGVVPEVDLSLLDPDWGEPGLSPAERVFAWNTLEVLAMTAGNPDAPVGAIPGSARAHCQLRFVVDLETPDIEVALRKHLDRHGFSMVDLTVEQRMEATRLDPEHPWVTWALDSLASTTGTTPALLPNIGGTLPNAPFALDLGLPTIWVPHSYPGCGQHAPDEHLPMGLVRQSLQIMTGLFWDLAELSSWPARATTD